MFPEFLKKHAAYNSTSPVHYKDFAFNPNGITVTDRTVCAYVAMYGNKDRDDDIIIKGAFAKSIAERGPESEIKEIAYLWQHDMHEPLGRPLVLEERDAGLYAENFHDAIPQADRALEQQKSGTLKFFSIGYQYIWDKIEYDEEKEAFICKELMLFEESLVTIASNNMTGIVGIKSPELMQYRNELVEKTESFIKSLNPKKQYALRQLIAEHLSLKDTQPLDFLKQALKEVDKPTANVVDWNKIADAFL